MITLGEAKAHLRVEHADEDTLIASLVSAATAHLDGWSGVLGRALVTQTWRQDFPCFAAKLRLALAPLSSLSSVTYYDTDNASQTLSSDIYQALSDGIGPYVTLKADQVWPNVYGRVDAVRVTYVTGYGAASAVPQPIKQAMLLMIGHWYDAREEATMQTLRRIPAGAEALLAPYRRTGL